MRRGYQTIAFMALLLLLVTACQTSATGSPAESAAASAGTTVNVTLQEWSVLPDADSVPAGAVTFVVTNEGPDDVHEVVIIRTDLDPGALPTDATGVVDEAAEGMEVIDEIEDIAVGDTGEVSVTLEAGSYVLICNIYDETKQEAHYAEGMRIGFTVE